MSRSYLVIRDEDLGLLLTQLEGADVKQNDGAFIVRQYVTVIQIKLQNILAEKTKVRYMQSIFSLFTLNKHRFVWYVGLYVLNYTLGLTQKNPKKYYLQNRFVYVIETGNVMLCGVAFLKCYTL